MPEAPSRFRAGPSCLRVNLSYIWSSSGRLSRGRARLGPPIGPSRIARRLRFELGLEGFDFAPSRPVPKFREDAAERIFSPWRGASRRRRPRSPWRRREVRGAGSARTKCRSGGIRNNQNSTGRAGISQGDSAAQHRSYHFYIEEVTGESDGSFSAGEMGRARSGKTRLFPRGESIFCCEFRAANARQAAAKDSRYRPAPSRGRFCHWRCGRTRRRNT